MGERPQPPRPWGALIRREFVSTMRPKFLLLLCLAGMEICPICAILLLVSHRACGGCLPLPTLLGFYVVALMLYRYARRRAWGWPVYETLGVTAWMATLLLLSGLSLYVLPDRGGELWIPSLFRGALFSGFIPSPAFLTLLASVILWACGRRLARVSLDHSTVLGEFQFGMVLLLIVLLMDNLWSLGVPDLSYFTLGFFLLALLAMGVALAQGGTGWLFGSHRVPWLGFLFASICLVLAAALLMSWFITPDLLKLLLDLLMWLWQWVSTLFAKLIAFLMSLFPPERYEMPLPPVRSPLDRDPSLLAKMLRIPDSVRRVAGIMVATLWIIVFLVALWSLSTTLLRWLRRRLVGMEEVEVQPLKGAFLEDLVALVRFIFRKLAGLWRLLRRLCGQGRKGMPGPPEIATVREVYRRLLKWAARVGCPRHTAQTPREYLSFLMACFPEQHWELAFITQIYVQARYSLEQPTRSTVEILNACWQKVKRSRPQKGPKPVTIED